MTQTITYGKKYIYFWYNNAAFLVFTFHWACICKHLSPHSWDQKQVKVTVYNEVGKGEMILFQTVSTLCWLLSHWNETGELRDKLHNYIDEPSWQRQGSYVHGPANSFSSFLDAGRGKKYCTCVVVWSKPPPPRWHVSSPAWHMSKQDRGANVDHCTKGSISSSLRPVHLTCGSYVQGKGCTLERLSTTGGRRGSKVATIILPRIPQIPWADGDCSSSSIFLFPARIFAAPQTLCVTPKAPGCFSLHRCSETQCPWCWTFHPFQ